jgi:hypothetical protein
MSVSQSGREPDHQDHRDVEECRDKSREEEEDVGVRELVVESALDMITKRTFTYEEETSNTNPSPDDRQPELAKATTPEGQHWITEPL